MVASLNAGRHNQAEFKRTNWHVVPEEGTAVSDMLDPAYWQHIGYKMRPGDLVEVHAEDGTWFATMLVRDSGPNYARVAVTSFIEFDARPEFGSKFFDDYAVEFKGPNNRWCVLRKKDGEYMKKQLSSKSEGTAWLADYAKALGHGTPPSA